MKAESFRRRARRGDLIEYAACAAVLSWCGFELWSLPGASAKAGILTMMLATLFVAHQLRRHGASRTAPENATATLIHSYREELVRRRDLLRNSWRLFVVPLVLGILVMLGIFAFNIGRLPHRPPSGEGPLLVLATAIIFVGAVIGLYNRRQARGVQSEIDRLDNLEHLQAAHR